MTARHSVEKTIPVGAYTPPVRTGRSSGPVSIDRIIGLADGQRPLWNLLVRTVGKLREHHDGLVADNLVDVATPECPEDFPAALLGAIAQAGRAEAPNVRELARQANVRELLTRVRRDFIKALDEIGAPGELQDLTRLLRAIDTVEVALVQDAAHRFLGRLSGPDATQLVVEVAHDMRSPLGSILFLAEHLRTGGSGGVNAIQARQLGLIYSAALGLSGITSDVMELARGGDRLAAHPPIPFSVADVVDGALAIVRPMAEEKGLELRATLPDADFRLGHPTALGRVLLNLVTNALKFTSSGSVHVIVEPVERTALRFTVLDTGRGIPPQVLTTLCDSFRTRAENGYSFSSAGLGLAICHKLISAMGGELGVDTELEKGTRFFFQLELPPAPRM